MELSKKQKEIIYTNKKNITVLAAAGSGKTLVLTERLKFLLLQGFDPTKIVAITFTNAAAEEMRERIGDKAKDCFIGTIHSYANFLLTAAGVDTSGCLNEEKFDELFELVSSHPYCIQQVGYLLLDEAQDSTTQQFDFIFNYICPEDFFIVFDHRQSIYSFNGANPNYMLSLSKRPNVNSFSLNENYRNPQIILDYAGGFLLPLGSKFYDDSIAMSDEWGSIYKIPYDNVKIGRFILDSGTPFGDWFALTRYNNQLNSLKSTLESMGIPCETFKKAGLTNQQIKEKMNSNTVKVLTVHTAKGLEANNVVVAGVHYKGDEERRIDYVAATRAKKMLVWCTGTGKPKKKMEKWD